jgi:hypothetical protein
LAKKEIVIPVQVEKIFQGRRIKQEDFKEISNDATVNLPRKYGVYMNWAREGGVS